MSSVFSGYQTAKTRDHADNKREEQSPFLRCLDIGRSTVKVSDLPLREKNVRRLRKILEFFYYFLKVAK